MRKDEAQKLQKDDYIEWTWRHPKCTEREFGTITGVNDNCFSVNWDNTDGPDSIFFFDEHNRLFHLAFVNFDTVYAPLEPTT